MSSDQDRAAAMAREAAASIERRFPNAYIEGFDEEEAAALLAPIFLHARRAGRREGLAKAEALCIDLASDDCSAGYAARRIAALRQQEAPDAE